jgi:hypothetical protein
MVGDMVEPSSESDNEVSEHIYVEEVSRRGDARKKVVIEDGDLAS